jgi:hypothetical protein
MRLRLRPPSGHADLADPVAGLNALAAADRDRAQVQVAGDVRAVDRLDRNRQSGETKLRRVRHLARACSRDRRSHLRADVDAAVHPARVRVRVIVQVVRDHGAAHRPGPVGGRRSRRQQREQRKCRHETDPQPRLP